MELFSILAAHFIGDFFTQTDKGILQREKRGWRAPYMYLHGVIHFALIWLLLWEINAWVIASVIAITHVVIDGLKVFLKGKVGTVQLFISDQFAHIGVIFAAWMLFYNPEFTVTLSNEWLFILGGFLLVTNPAAYTIGTIMGYWSDNIEIDENESLPDAGKTIGILERIFVYVAMIIGSPEIIGFLIAAKSVFRFGDISKAKNRKLTEYILIGTLLSFLTATGVGLLITSLL
jgi:hypothetical protein